uniref:Histone deacetylase domain-containing protein n=1 Tax=Timema douglasi TaxID=61478 RepID=A0A7R8Z733_TIMDO|nr:unnamed protein product [Timema douglasi]
MAEIYEDLSSLDSLSIGADGEGISVTQKSSSVSKSLVIDPDVSGSNSILSSSVGLFQRTEMGTIYHKQLANVEVTVADYLNAPTCFDSPASCIPIEKYYDLSEKKKPSEVFMEDVYEQTRESKIVVCGITGVTYDPRMECHRNFWDPNYPECPERFSSVMLRCTEYGLLQRCKFLPPRRVTEEELLTKHSPDIIEILKQTSGSYDMKYLEDLSSNYDSIYVHPTTYQLSLLAAGSTIELVDKVCKKEVMNGMAIVRPPGHHAMYSEFCGYCYFNNVALAAHHALNNCEASRILIVDWDVHHGQATQQMFYDDPRVLYFSIHRYEYGEFWPNLKESDFHYIGTGKGKGYNFNVPLNRIGMTDGDYLAIFQQLLLPVASEFQPDLIIVSAGYDAALGCLEGQMEVTPACYSHLLWSLLQLSGGKVAVVLEGGYCLSSLAEGAALTLRALLGDPCPILTKVDPPCASIVKTILNVIYAHREFWHCLVFQKLRDLDSQEKSSVAVYVDTDEIQTHVPEVKFEGSEIKLSKFPTRNSYAVQTSAEIEEFEIRLENLRSKTSLTVAQNKVCLVYDEVMLKHVCTFNMAHVETPNRLVATWKLLKEYHLLDRCLRLKGRLATDSEISLVHSDEYMDFMKRTEELDNAKRKEAATKLQSVYFNEHTLTAAKMAVGSVLEVLDSVLLGESQTGFALVRPPGHHAEKDTCFGFCFFNNVAVAASVSVSKYNLKRVLILDWDIHHGNGIQHSFSDSSSVLYISIHRYDNGNFYPGSPDASETVVGTGDGIGFTVNIPWSKSKMGDVEYLSAFQQVVLPIAYEYNPELVLVAAGFDAAWGDFIGSCSVTPECFALMTHWLSALAGGRVILCMEGGYNVTSVSHSVVMCTKALLGDPLPVVRINRPLSSSAVDDIRRVINVHSKYWKSLSFQAYLPSGNVLPDPGE